MLSRLTNFFSIFCFPYKALQNQENSNFRVLPSSGLLTLQTLLLAIYNVERFVPLSFLSICSVHSGAFVAYSCVTLVSFSSLRCHSSLFQYIPVPFLSIPFHSAVIPARSGTFRHHSCPFYFIPASFCLVPVYSGLFRYIPFRSCV